METALVATKKCILVIDNDSDVLDSVEYLLSIAGYKVLIAYSAEQAYQLLAREIVHVAVIDVRLKHDDQPEDHSGFDMAKALPPYIPYVVFTAYEDKDIMPRAWQIGAENSVDKTADDAGQQLVRVINQMFETKVDLNFDLRIHSRPDLASLARQIEVPGAETAMAPNEDDLQRILQALFYQAEEVDVSELLAPEQALLAPMHLRDTAAAGAFKNPQIDKAYQVVLALRAIAAEQLNLHGDTREYYQALLFHTLNVIRLRQPSNDKKQHALLAAALICERLDSWPNWEHHPLARPEPPILPPPAPVVAQQDSAEIAAIGDRLLGASIFVLLGVGAIALLWGLMRVFNPSYQEQVIGLITLSVLIIPALAIVGLVNGATAVRALLAIVAHVWPKHDDPNDPPNNKTGA